MTDINQRSLLTDSGALTPIALGMPAQVSAQAATLAPAPANDPDLPVAGRSLIGQPISRLDGPLKVRGQATFAAEFPIDGMAYAALAFSTIAKGRITRSTSARPRPRPAWSS